MNAEQRPSVYKDEQDSGRWRRQTPTARGDCRWNAQFRAVAEGGTKRRLEREMGALDAGTWCELHLDAWGTF